MANASDISGCCNAFNYYNLGGAHGFKTAETQDEFDKEIGRLKRRPVNIAITNAYQEKTRKFLEAQGWDTRPVGHLWVSTITGSTLEMYFYKKRQEKRKKEQEALAQLPPAIVAEVNDIPKVTLVEVQDILDNPHLPSGMDLHHSRMTLLRNRWGEFVTSPFLLTRSDAGLYAYEVFSSIKTQVANYKKRKSRESR